MDSSMFSSGELPPRRYESVDMRNGDGHGAAAECHQRNCMDEFYGNQAGCFPGRVHAMLPEVREIHRKTFLYGTGHVQTGSVHMTCSCSGCQQSEHFYDDLGDDDDHHQSQRSSHKRYRHGITGSSTPSRKQNDLPHGMCDRGCCGSVAMRRERSASANCVAERTGGRSRSSLFVESLEFQRNAAAVGSMSNFPLKHGEVETRSSALHTGFMANSPAKSRAPLTQIILYGWYLMNPSREGHASDPSTLSSVAIGGYRCPRMEDQDFVGTGTVVERLERWKLRTSDGLEVGLMGMINIEKSVASGFSPSLVQCFMIGFPSAWVYMLLNMRKVVPKISSPGIPSPSASPTSSAGPPGITGNTIRECLGTTIAPDADLVQSILQSPLFTAGPDVTRTTTLGGCPTSATTPITPRVQTSDRTKRPRSELHSPAADIPLVDPVVAPADSFHSCDRQVDAAPNVTEEKEVAGLGGELEIEDTITHKDDVNVEVDQSCKVKDEGRHRARRKRYKIPRNYYQRGKKKSSTKR